MARGQGVAGPRMTGAGKMHMRRVMCNMAAEDRASEILVLDCSGQAAAAHLDRRRHHHLDKVKRTMECRVASHVQRCTAGDPAVQSCTCDETLQSMFFFNLCESSWLPLSK